MGSFFGIIYGVILGALGALFIVVAWGVVGIFREYMLGCLGGFITFVIIELPVWVGLPIWIGMMVTLINPNLTGSKTGLAVYITALVVLLSKNAVTKVRIVVENIFARR